MDEENWNVGFDAGINREPSRPISPGMDGLAWSSGYIEGQAEADKIEQNQDQNDDFGPRP
jgi:hypothetical protein